MKDEYTTAFYNLVKEAQSTTGFELPIEIEAYVVMLLADKIDKPNFLPQTTFAQEFLKLKRPYNHTAKELGDSCLFVTGVFPEYGISVRYYSDIGKTSYTLVQEGLNAELFGILATQFDFIRDFINLTVRSNKSPITAIR
jgi:hypothetical protein